MPRDLVNEPKTLEEVKNSEPSLAALTYVLKHMEELLPHHDYNHGFFLLRDYCGTAGCAFGICQLLWPHRFLYAAIFRDHANQADACFGEGAYARYFDLDAYLPMSGTRDAVLERLTADQPALMTGMTPMDLILEDGKGADYYASKKLMRFTI